MLQITNTNRISLARWNQYLAVLTFVNNKHNKATILHHFQALGNELLENSDIMTYLKGSTKRSTP